jgi:hypothetical protein
MMLSTSALLRPPFVAACAPPPHGKILVRGGSDSLDNPSTVDMAQLDCMAKETGAGGAHRAYGFYFGSVAYTVTVDIGNPVQNACQGPIAINVAMRLTDRQVVSQFE